MNANNSKEQSPPRMDDDDESIDPPAAAARVRRRSEIVLTPSMYNPRTSNIGFQIDVNDIEGNDDSLEKEKMRGGSIQHSPDLVRIINSPFSTPVARTTRPSKCNGNICKDLKSFHISQDNSTAIFTTWARSLCRMDPRHQILSFFNEVAQVGTRQIEYKGLDDVHSTPPPLKVFDKAGVFTVWRPTSITAIRKMMLGQGVGKGLDIKGKSAKRGKLSGFVPFVQIHHEKHKSMVRTLPRNGRMRVFFSTRQARIEVMAVLQPMCNEMVNGYMAAQHILTSTPKPSNEPLSTTDECHSEDAREEAMQRYMWEMDNPAITVIDDYAGKQCFGIELPERLFWEAFVVRQDITRENEYETGRHSEPSFQDMNFESLRGVDTSGKYPRPVVYQSADASCSPMCPLTLLMAYEENQQVLPVVSDFDCFLVGTRGVAYETPLPQEQLELMHWSVDTIQSILESPPSNVTWTMRWLEVLKKMTANGFHPKMPKYGFGDIHSYSIMAHAIERLAGNGAVRHGAECFNYYFPQELDDMFLVISNHLPGNVKWRNVSKSELLHFLSNRIDEGFTFPLNPKNVLCDLGWKEIYDKLMSSQKRNVQDSLNIWFPPDSGIREKIESIHSAYPSGFYQTRGGGVRKERRYSPLLSSLQAGVKLDGTTAMDLAKFELKHHVVLERAKLKLRAALFMLKIHREKRTEEDKERRDAPDEVLQGEESSTRV